MADQDYKQEAVTQISIDVAVLEERMAQRDKEIEQLTRVIEQLTAKVEVIASTLSEARGGWRVLMLVGGAAGALGSAVTWVASHLRFG